MGYSLAKHARRTAALIIAEGIEEGREPPEVGDAMTVDVAQPHQDGVQSWTRVTVHVTADVLTAARDVAEAVRERGADGWLTSLRHDSDGHLIVGGA